MADAHGVDISDHDMNALENIIKGMDDLKEVGLY